MSSWWWPALLYHGVWEWSFIPQNSSSLSEHLACLNKPPSTTVLLVQYNYSTTVQYSQLQSTHCISLQPTSQLDFVSSHGTIKSSRDKFHIFPCNCNCVCLFNIALLNLPLMKQNMHYVATRLTEASNHFYNKTWLIPVDVTTFLRHIGA